MREGFLDLVRLLGGVGKYQQRVRMHGGCLKHFDSVLTRFSRLSTQKLKTCKLDARFVVGGLNCHGLKEESVRLSSISSLEEAFSQARCHMSIVSIELIGVQVFDAGFL